MFSRPCRILDTFTLLTITIEPRGSRSTKENGWSIVPMLINGGQLSGAGQSRAWHIGSAYLDAGTAPLGSRRNKPCLQSALTALPIVSGRA